MRKKRKKLYYIPGMISLVFLPILCFWTLKENYRAEERCMEISLPVKNYANPPRGVAGIRVMERTDINRNYTTFKFTGNDKEDKIQLDSSAVLLKKIVHTEDTVNAIHFVLEEKAKYATFIEILDLCAYTDTFPTALYTIEDNKIWYLHKKMPEEEKQQWRERLKDKNDYWEEQRKIKEYFPKTGEEKSFKEKITAFFYDKDIRKMKYFFVIYAIFFCISMNYIWKNFIRK